MTRYFRGVVVAAALAFPANTAWPCSQAAPGFYRFVPPEDAKIPKNTRVTIEHSGSIDPTASIFELDFGFPVPVGRFGDDFLTVSIDAAAGGIPITLTVEEPNLESLVIQYAEVDVAEDLIAPSFNPGVIDFSYRHVINKAGGLCHGDGFVVEVSFDSATDNTGVAFYALYGDVEAENAPTLLHADKARQKFERYVGPRAGKRCFYLGAADWAGNHTYFIPTDESLCFDFVESDMGGLETAESSCGCHASGRESPSNLVWIVLFLAGRWSACGRPAREH